MKKEKYIIIKEFKLIYLIKFTLKIIIVLSFNKLKLIGIEGIIKGGSTKPLLIRAENDNGDINPYVLKLYKKDNVANNFTIAKEILVTELALEFNLPVPQYGIIEFDLELLKDFYSDNEISLFNDGYKFCSLYYDSYVIYSPIVNVYFLKEYHMENVFAFDNIILNTDRGGFRNKPNLLIGDKDFLLIDHELTFPFINCHVNLDNIDYMNSFNTYYYKHHIFYDKLTKRRNRNKIFDEFYENIRILNTSKFNDIFAQLENLGIEYGKKEFIFDYLDWIKNKKDYIHKTLNERIA